MKKQGFIEKIKPVADILGYTMTMPEESYQNQAKLTQGNIVINIRNGGYQSEHKISISGSYPKDCHDGISYHGLKNPHINCADSKTPEQIARDIQKRFLPAYLEDLQKVIEMNTKTQQYADARYQIIKTLADLLGVEPEKDHRNEYSLRLPSQLYYRHCGLQKIEVDYYGTRVDLKLELTPEQAIKVLTLLKG